MAGTTEGGKKTAMGGRGDPHKASPAAIEHYIKGVSFPVNKEELIDLAERNDAPEDVLYVMRNFSDKEYGSVVDIAKEVGKVNSNI